jgi:hypothetical protein
MRVVVAHRAIQLALERKALESVDRTREPGGDVGELLAERRRRRGLAVRAREHGNAGVLMRERAQVLVQSLQRGQEHVAARVRKRDPVREIVDVLGGQREVHEPGDASDRGYAGEPLVQPVFDGLDVVVRGSLDRLDARRVGNGELASGRLKRLAYVRGERRGLGDRRLVGERHEPRDLDPHAAGDQAELGKVRAQRVELARVAAVQRRQRHQRGFDGHLGCAFYANRARAV